MKSAAWKLLIVVATFWHAANADTFLFTDQTGGTGMPSALTYGTATLTLNTSDPGCTAIHNCVHVDVSAATGYEFQNDAAGSVFGFNDPADPGDINLTIFNCDASIGAGFCVTVPPNTTANAVDSFDGFGSY